MQLLLRFLGAFFAQNQYISAPVVALFRRFFYTKINTVVQILKRFYDAFMTQIQKRN